jgi:hypothetical protein
MPLVSNLQNPWDLISKMHLIKYLKPTNKNILNTGRHAIDSTIVHIILLQEMVLSNITIARHG